MNIVELTPNKPAGWAESCAATLSQARASETKIESAAAKALGINTAGDAHAVQKAMCGNPGPCGKYAGWKGGATNLAAQSKFGISEPFRGPLFAEFIENSPATVSAAKRQVLVAEAEIAFVMASDLPPRGTPYSREEVWAAVKAVCPAVELVGQRCEGEDLLAEGPCFLLADGAGNSALVLGPETPSASFSPTMLTTTLASLSFSGDEVAKGPGANVHGCPLEALVWLANDVCKRPVAEGEGLRAGDVVTSGAIVAAPVTAPCDIVVDVAGLGVATCHLVP